MEKRIGEKPAGLVVAQVLQGGPAEALGEGALGLPEIHVRVDALADVVDDISLVEAVGSSQDVHRGRHDGASVDVIGEGTPPLGFRVVVEVRRRVEAVGGEVDPLVMGLA